MCKDDKRYGKQTRKARDEAVATTGGGSGERQCKGGKSFVAVTPVPSAKNGRQRHDNCWREANEVNDSTHATSSEVASDCSSDGGESIRDGQQCGDKGSNAVVRARRMCSTGAWESRQERHMDVSIILWTDVTWQHHLSTIRYISATWKRHTARDCPTRSISATRISPDQQWLTQTRL